MKLIEKTFPVKEVNALATHEMAFLRFPSRWLKEEVKKALDISKDIKMVNSPRFHNIHYYPAREPLAVARVLNAAAVLPADVALEELLRIVGVEGLRKRAEAEGRFHRLFSVEPDREALRRRLGGYAPLVVDPMAGGGSIPLEAKRLGLRVVAGDLNPVAYLLQRASIEFPARFGKRLFQLALEEAKKLIEYTQKELAKYYPEDAKAIIYVKGATHTCGGVVPIVKVTTLSKEKGLYYGFEFKDGTVHAKLQDRPYSLPSVCPHCGKPLSVKDLQRKWAEEHKRLIGDLLAGKTEGIEERIRRLYIPVAVVKVKGGYREPTEEDIKFLVEAAKELTQLKDAMFVLPTAQIDRDNEVFKPVVDNGLTHWHHLFNPRQLLTLYKLIKYIRERAKELKEKYGELGVAVALYLAIGISKSVDYDSILVQWDSNTDSIRNGTGDYALSREMEIGYDFVDANLAPITLPWAFEVDVAESGKLYLTRGGILPVLRWLSESLEGLWGEGDAIYLWDATELDKYLPSKSVDVIHVDPPYYEQHDYTGISEFFWQVLRSALDPVLDVLFPPERVKISWSPRSASLPKAREIKGEPGSSFGDKMEQFFRAARTVLKDDGLFMLWYTYGKVEGWEELFFRLHRAGFAVTRAWQVWTQAPQRLVASVGTAFNTSIVVVARPMQRQLIQGRDDPKFREAVYSEAKKTAEMLLERGLLGEAAVTAIANGLAASTRFEALDGTQARGLMSAAISIAVDAFLDALAERLGVPKARAAFLDPRSKLYLYLLILSDERLRVKHDVANRLAQVLGARLEGILYGKGEAKELAHPRDVAAGRQTLGIARILKTIYDVDKLCAKGMVRAAEAKLKELGEEELALAKFIAAAAGEKLGLKCGKALF